MPFQSRFTTTLPLLAACLGVFPFSGAANPTWYKPDFASLQYAGNLGLLSLGLGKAFRDQRLWTSLHYGIVPPATGSETIHTLAVKTSLTLARTRLPNYTLRPFYLGLAVTYTLGEEFDTRSGKPWPEDYFPQAAFQFQPYLGAALDKRLPDGRQAGVYLEVGTLAKYLEHELQSQDYLTLGDVLNVALGATLQFH